MIPTAALRKMLDAGLTFEQAVDIAEAWEAGSVKARSAGAERAHRYRERKANGVTKSVTRHVTDNAKDVSPTPPSEISPIPPKGVLSPKPTPLEKPTSEATKPLSKWVGEIWEITPRPGRARSGKRSLETALKAAMHRGDDPARIKLGLVGYYDSPDARKHGGEYAQGVHTVISSGRWETFAEADAEPPTDDDPWPRRMLRWNAAGYWNSEWGPKPGKPDYCGPPETEARAA